MLMWQSWWVDPLSSYMYIYIVLLVFCRIEFPVDGHMYTCTVMSSTDTGTPSSTDIPNSSETSHSNPPPHTPPPHNVHTSKPTSLRVPITTCDVKDIPKPTSKVDNTTIDDSRPTDSDEVELIPLPPPHPRGGVSILAHKLWIGNLDKRLTE